MNPKEFSILSPEKVNIRRACVLVHNIMNNDICVALQSHFKKHAHIKTTRNNNCSATLPKINTEYARQGFFYIGAKLYNNLPTSVRTAANGKDFKEKLDIIFRNEVALSTFSFTNMISIHSCKFVN